MFTDKVHITNSCTHGMLWTVLTKQWEWLWSWQLYKITHLVYTCWWEFLGEIWNINDYSQFHWHVTMNLDAYLPTSSETQEQIVRSEGSQRGETFVNTARLDYLLLDLEDDSPVATSRSMKWLGATPPWMVYAGPACRVHPPLHVALHIPQW